MDCCECRVVRWRHAEGGWMRLGAGDDGGFRGGPVTGGVWGGGKGGGGGIQGSLGSQLRQCAGFNQP